MILSQCSLSTGTELVFRTDALGGYFLTTDSRTAGIGHDLILLLGLDSLKNAFSLSLLCVHIFYHIISIWISFIYFYIDLWGNVLLLHGELFASPLASTPSS